MNLIQQIKKGNELIDEGKNKGKDTSDLEEKGSNLKERLNERVKGLKLTELAKRKIAVLVDSKVLGCKVWFCSNDDLANQVKEDDPSAVCYTVSELRELIKLNPDSDALKGIHNAKTAFTNSKIMDAELRKDFYE